MLSNTGNFKMYTPEQVAEALQLSKNTIYGLISKGEIVAKKIGRVYRIPESSISFMITGLDYDLYKKEQEDLKVFPRVIGVLKKVRKNLK